MSRKRRSLGSDMAIVAQNVADLKNEFQYPDVAGRGVSTARPIGGGGGGGAPTIVVAASDASDFSKDRADFICEGSDDHLTIQAAIDLTPGFGIGGRVLLTEGSFFCQYGGIDAGFARAIHLQGMGDVSTRLHFDGGSGPGLVVPFVTDIYVPTGSSTSDAIIQLGTEVRGCRFNSSGTAIDVVLSGGGDQLISNCLFTNDGIGIDATPSSGRGLIVTGNHFVNTGSNAISASDIEGLLIAGNNINIFLGSGIDAIVLSAIEGAIVADNWLVASSGDGLRLVNSDYCKVIGNHIDASATGLSIEGTSSRNFITANTWRDGGDIGVEITDATCDCNFVVGNDLGDPANYTTDALVDGGTDTQLFWPADATYGDNFTACPPGS